MTKFNWERAARNSRYLRAIFSQDRPILQKLEFEIKYIKNIDAEFPNPIGLTDEDCLGRLPDLNKRMKIINQLIQTESELKEIYLLKKGVSLNEAVEKAAKDFQQFCRFVSLTCDIKSSHPENFWSIVVCISVFYLSYYNSVVADKGKKVPKLSSEILDRLQVNHWL